MLGRSVARLVLLLGSVLALVGGQSLASAVAASPGSAVWAAWRYTEPTLVFYGDRAQPWRMTGAADDLRAVLAGNDGPYAVVALEYEAKLDRLLRAGRTADPRDQARYFSEEIMPILRRAGYQPAETIEGLNTGRGTWVALRVWRRDG